MRNSSYGRVLRPFPEEEENVVGEILEDIECLNIDENVSGCYDELNDDTFGGGADCCWDPTETFKEAESAPLRRRANRELVKCELFDFPDPEPSTYRRQRRPRQPGVSNQGSDSANTGHSSGKSVSNHKPGFDLLSESQDHSASFKSDLAKYRRLGMFGLNSHLVDLVHQGASRSHRRWQVTEKTLERHMRGVERTASNMDKELFMDDHAFDQILRIHLTQICKDPRLQNYTGRWNTRHLNMHGSGSTQSNGTQSGDPVADQIEPPNTEPKREVNPNRFGKTSSASVRHGRKIIRLSDVNPSVVDTGPVSRERQLRDTIERGYEALYMLCDIEEEIEQCPMNHVAALDKMQKNREGKLNDLFISLTTGSIGIEDIMCLNKGRVLMIKLGRKLSIDTKLQLACCMVRCAPLLARICAEVDAALCDVPSAVPLIHLLASSSQLRPLVAFDREVESSHNFDHTVYIHQRLAKLNSFTKCFLFILESLTMTGHLFLLTPETGGRETALQRCCHVMLRSQHLSLTFQRLLSSRGGVIFMNVLLERIRQNPMAVDKDSMDMLLHYTLEVSELITTTSDEWKSLASTIMQMFR
ncbi:hypothetical protein protein, putative [Babesia ovis]|uniref:Uncharacterized protein n=1 Tax=Babesia ovis TaxID=5869 RepID=A0A9W5WV61_BABOV|nr:hypothetical protein protein, putative [Babesia ovis]